MKQYSKRRNKWSSWKYKKSYHSFPRYYDNADAMKEWCETNFPGNWAFTKQGWYWRFRYKKDYLTFLLRWS